MMKLEHVALNVSNPIEMAAWYVEHCKMKIVLKIDEPPFTRFIADSDNKTALELYVNEDAPIPDYFQQHHLVYHNAFSVEEMDRTMNELIEAGASFVEEINQDNGNRLVMLRDPWGIPLQLVQRTRSQKWY